MIGHELTHIANRDVMVMTLASFFASIASFIVQMGFWFGGMFDDDTTTAVPGLAVILISALVYAISLLLLQALSRYREFAADRGSAMITGRPSALISALMKIEGQMSRSPSATCALPRASSPPSTSCRRGQAVAPSAVCHASDAGEEGRRRCSSSSPSCRAPRPSRGAARNHHRQAEARPPRAGPAVRDEHRIRDARDGPENQQPAGRPRSSSNRWRRPTSTGREGYGGGRASNRQRQWHDRRAL